MKGTFANNFKVTRVANSATAATTAVTSSAAIDMSGWDGVIYIAALGDVTANCVLTLTAYKVATNATSGGTSVAATSAFTAGASDADNKFLAVDVGGSSIGERYSYATLTRTAANAVVDGIFAIQYKGKSLPAAGLSTALASASAIS